MTCYYRKIHIFVTRFRHCAFGYDGWQKWALVVISSLFTAGIEKMDSQSYIGPALYCIKERWTEFHFNHKYS